MKIYLASRYSRREELCQYRKVLQALGHEVTSRWLDGAHQISDSGTPIGDDGEALVEGDGDSPECAAMRARFAREDVEDVRKSDCVISFTEPPRSNSNRGGRHVEFGLAYALGKRLIVVGYRENVFHWISSVMFFKTFEELIDALHDKDNSKCEN